MKFSKGEIDKIKEVDQPNMTLLGFKSADEIKEEENVKSSYFVYPDESRVKGSS